MILFSSSLYLLSHLISSPLSSLLLPSLLLPSRLPLLLISSPIPLFSSPISYQRKLVGARSILATPWFAVFPVLSCTGDAHRGNISMKCCVCLSHRTTLNKHSLTPPTFLKPKRSELLINFILFDEGEWCEDDFC